MTNMAPTIPLPVIGVVRSRYSETEDTPIQARLNPDAEAVAEIGEQYAAGLEGLENFDFAWLLTWLHHPRADAGPPALARGCRLSIVMRHRPGLHPNSSR